MKNFFDDNLLLYSKSAVTIYNQIKHLPIVDYHCHLDQYKIQSDAKFDDIGELWLSADHYKWRAMRMCGVEELYITGNASYHDKFVKYAQIFPQLVGNPLYYWTQMELKTVFGINLPLSGETAEQIYAEANAKLKDISVLALLKQFNVEYVVTTDAPCDNLKAHGIYGNTTVAPTFRPDKVLTFDNAEMTLLAQTVGAKLDTLDDFVSALENRLAYFVEHGCKIADHGFATFPSSYASYDDACKLFANRKNLTENQKQSLFGYLLVQLAKLYKKCNVLMQLHFGVTRNVNPQKFDQCGADSGFDVMASPSKIEDVILFFQQLSDEQRPQTVLYTLNDVDLKSLACVTGAFKNVKLGPAWWFNDTVQGIGYNLQTIAEYSCLGTNFGMLTDSRSFSSYVRFDFFRRILANYLGDLVEKGEYHLKSAITVAQNVAYYNIKNTLGV
ncbi:MAG: glucuronate isomerase [Clostridia bacterium]|nr:glucuronate isomerase [Clostridia bacterium]